MSLTRFRCANSLRLLELQKCGTQRRRDSAQTKRTKSKTKGPGGNRTRDLSHPKGESYLSPNGPTQPPTRIELVTLCLRGTCSAN